MELELHRAKKTTIKTLVCHGQVQIFFNNMNVWHAILYCCLHITGIAPLSHLSFSKLYHIHNPNREDSSLKNLI